MSSLFLPALGLITPKNSGPIVTIVTFVFLAIAAIVVLIKLASSFYFKSRMYAVDIPIWIALVGWTHGLPIAWNWD